MLKTSPVLTNCAGGSPATFRRSHAATTSTSSAAARSPQVSSRLPTTSSLVLTTSAASTGPSLNSAVSSESNALLTRTPHDSAQGPHETVDSRQKGPVSVSTPQISNTTTSEQHASISSTIASHSSLGRPEPQHQSPKVLSPNKRRSSPPRREEQVTSAAAVASASQLPVPTASKRARTDGESVKVLPQRYELCATEDIVELVALMLAELIATNDAIRTPGAGLTRFHSRTAPGISVRDYLHRLARHATLTPPLLLAMVYYIDRLCAMYPDFTINTLTVHRFLITAATVAAKGLSDSFWNNPTYARVGGVRVAELKLLELEFLYRVDWKIVPNPEVLVAYYRGLVERTPQYTLDSESSFDNSSADDDDEDDEDDGG